MNLIYVDHAGYHLEKAEGAMLVRNTDGQILRSLPIRHVERLYLQGDQHLHTGLLLALLEHGCEIVFLSPRKNQVMGQILGPKHQDARIRQQQYAWSNDPEHKLLLSSRWVRSKLLTQKRATQRWLRAAQGDRHTLLLARDRLEQNLAALSSAQHPALLGLEGSAAAAYFPAYFSTLPLPVRPKERSRRPPRDPANALLSLGYTLLLKEAVHVAHAHGLDPYVGFYHELSFGRESLACDLIEPLRTRVDLWVAALLNDGLLRAESFGGEDGVACHLGKAGCGIFYREWAQQVSGLRRSLRRYARCLVRQLRGRDASNP
ncbi:MAG: CRISPR-associated endonuclease Cas1 [Acidithiobacillus sp.]